jgi:tRNA(adenine34) deaminase
MCAGALFWSQIDKVVFGARDEKRGAGTVGKSLYHPSTLVVNGVLETECSDLMKDFFGKKRR